MQVCTVVLFATEARFPVVAVLHDVRGGAIDANARAAWLRSASLPVTPNHLVRHHCGEPPSALVVGIAELIIVWR